MVYHYKAIDCRDVQLCKTDYWDLPNLRELMVPRSPGMRDILGGMRKYNCSGQCLGTAGRGIISERHPSLDSSLRTGRKVTANIDSQLPIVNRAICSDAWR